MKILFAIAFLFGTHLFAIQDMNDADAHNEVVPEGLASETTEALASAELCEDDFEIEDEEEEELFEKVGFLTVEDCALKGTFTSCYAEAYVCGFEGCFHEAKAGTIRPVQFVLFVHDDGKYYKLQLDGVKQYQLDEGLGRNEVTIIGNYDESTNTISVTEYEAPPPPKKSFFKGCL
jgi:uncharacterized ParB-like nuclease family protein